MTNKGNGKEQIAKWEAEKSKMKPKETPNWRKWKFNRFKSLSICYSRTALPSIFHRKSEKSYFILGGIHWNSFNEGAHSAFGIRHSALTFYFLLSTFKSPFQSFVHCQDLCRGVTSVKWHRVKPINWRKREKKRNLHNMNDIRLEDVSHIPSPLSWLACHNVRNQSQGCWRWVEPNENE